MGRLLVALLALLVLCNICVVESKEPRKARKAKKQAREESSDDDDQEKGGDEDEDQAEYGKDEAGAGGTYDESDDNKNGDGDEDQDGDEDHKDSDVDLNLHSFAPPIDMSYMLFAWKLSGASLFQKEVLLMNPDIVDRYGFAFNMFQMFTNNFEVTFHVDFKGEKIVSDQSLGFWYVMQNVSDSSVFDEMRIIKAESWKEGLAQQGFKLGGFLSKFDGFGAVLTTTDAKGRPRPVISYVGNHGDKELEWGKHVPAPGAKAIEFRNTKSPAIVKIRVQPHSIEGTFMFGNNHSRQIPMFKVNRTLHPVMPGGYIGFTSFSGSLDQPSACEVEITELKVINHDETAMGEMDPDMTDEERKAYNQMISDDARHLATQEEQKKQILEASNMLEKYVAAADEAAIRSIENVNHLALQMGNLGNDCADLKEEVNLFFKSDEKKVDVKNIQNGIVGLRALLLDHSRQEAVRLQSAHIAIQEVKQKTNNSGHEKLVSVVQQALELEKEVLTRGMHLSGMMVCFLFSVFGIGLLMWRRMCYYERKHFL